VCVSLRYVGRHSYQAAFVNASAAIAFAHAVQALAMLVEWSPEVQKLESFHTVTDKRTFDTATVVGASAAGAGTPKDAGDGQVMGSISLAIPSGAELARAGDGDAGQVAGDMSHGLGSSTAPKSVQDPLLFRGPRLRIGIAMVAVPSAAIQATIAGQDPPSSSGGGGGSSGGEANRESDDAKNNNGINNSSSSKRAKKDVRLEAILEAYEITGDAAASESLPLDVRVAHSLRLYAAPGQTLVAGEVALAVQGDDCECLLANLGAHIVPPSPVTIDLYALEYNALSHRFEKEIQQVQWTTRHIFGFWFLVFDFVCENSKY
jgi:hypothetical protein